MIPGYLRLDAAAALAQMPEDDFMRQAPALGLIPIAWGSAIFYRLADIEASIDAKWRVSTSGASPGICRGSRTASSTSAVLARLPKPRPRRKGAPAKGAPK